MIYIRRIYNFSQQVSADAGIQLVNPIQTLWILLGKQPEATLIRINNYVKSSVF